MALTDDKLNDINIPSEDNIVDITIAPIKRQRFRLNGDNNKVIELNTSDLGISTRLEKGWKELQKLVEDVANVDVEKENYLDLLH